MVTSYATLGGLAPTEMGKISESCKGKAKGKFGKGKDFKGKERQTDAFQCCHRKRQNIWPIVFSERREEQRKGNFQKAWQVRKRCLQILWQNRPRERDCRKLKLSSSPTASLSATSIGNAANSNGSTGSLLCQPSNNLCSAWLKQW